MFSVLPGYKSPTEFAKTFTNKKGKKGVTRAYIHQLIQAEKDKPNSTPIDVIEIDGCYYVRNSQPNKP